MSRPIVKRDDHRRAKKEFSWSVAIEKRAVLEEVRTFAVPHFDKTTCLPIIRKLLYLLNQGETFTKTEAAAVLCSVIKLNRFEDIYLRRMLYLIAKELCPIADEVDVVISSLLKDMKSENVVYRENAVRLLCRINNGTRPTQIEAYLKEAILDHHPMVKSAAIVCAINLLKSDPGIGRNFIEQVRGVVWSQRKLVQFHALCFLFRMHRDDLLAVEKLVTMYTEEIHFKRVTFSSPLSLCLLARSINQITRAMHVSVEQYSCYYTYLKSCIYHGDEMVAVQGVGSLEELNDMSRSELGLAIDVLRPFIHSPKPVVRFGAFRALFKVEVGRDVDWSSCEEHATWMADENIKKYLDYSMYTIDHKEDFLNEEPVPYVVPQVLKSQSNFAKKKEEEAAAAADPTHNLRKRLVSMKLRRIIKD